MKKRELNEQIKELQQDSEVLFSYSKEKFDECEKLRKENADLKAEIASYKETVKNLRIKVLEKNATMSLMDAEAQSYLVKKVISNKPATIVFFEDGSKSVVKCDKKDKYSKETGVMLACGKRLLENSVPDMDFLLDEELVKNIRLFCSLQSPNKDARIKALKEWEALDPKVRQRTKAKYYHYVKWAES